jgi:hypothetical protein
MGGLIQSRDLAQPDAFRFQALLDFLITIDLHELSRHLSSSGVFGSDMWWGNADSRMATRAGTAEVETAEFRSAGKERRRSPGLGLGSLEAAV